MVVEAVTRSRKHTLREHRRGTVLLTGLACALIALTPIAVLFPIAGSEPLQSIGGSDTITLTWDFDDPENYTLTDAELFEGRATLMQHWNSVVEDSKASFDLGLVKDNITTSDLPDSIVVDRSVMAVRTLVIQPGPEGTDSSLLQDNPYSNLGNDVALRIDSEQDKSMRIVMRFDVSSVPSDAVIRDAELWLSLIDGKNANVFYNMHALTAGFEETEVNWINRTASSQWSTPGGDYGNMSFHYGVFTQAVGWQSADISRMVDLWVRGALPNNGFVLVPVSGMGDALKRFVSSDDTASPSLRPKLVVNYTLPDILGTYESRVLDAGTNSTFMQANWSAEIFSFATDEFSGTGLSGKWSWLNDPSDGAGSYDVGITRPGWLHVVSDSQTNLTSTDITANFLYQEIAGDFVATTSVETEFSTSTMGAGILVADDVLSWMSIYLTDSGSTSYVVVKVGEGGAASVMMMIVWSYENAIFRIVRNSTTMSAYYSSDGVAWSLAYSYTPMMPFMQRVMAGPFVMSGVTSNFAIADFDFFRIGPVGTTAAVDVRARVGNTTDIADESWGKWGSILTPGEQVGEVGRYLQYQVQMLCPCDWYSPAFTDFDCEYRFYSAEGQIETREYSVQDFSKWYTITTYEEDNAGSVLYSWSTDGGLSWSPYVDGGSYSISSTEPSITIRIMLATEDTAFTPAIDRIEVTYGTALQSLFIVAPSVITAGDPFSITIYAKDDSNTTMTMWTGPITLYAKDSAGVENASGDLVVTEAFITTGGYVTVPDEVYTVAETFRILAVSNSVSGLSTPITVLPGPVSEVTIDPGLETLLEFETYVFTATALDEYGNPITTAEFAWSASAVLGTLTPDGNTATLRAGASGVGGYLTAAYGGFSCSLFLSITRHSLPPEFLADIPTQHRQEDSGSWSIDLTPYVQDPEEDNDHLRWYITNETIVVVEHWENVTGHMDITFSTVQDAFGTNVLNLFVVDSTGMSNSTQITVVIDPVNDKPTIDYIAPLVVIYDADYVYNFRYYVHDVDNPHEDLRLYVDDASEPYTVVNWLWITFNYPLILNGTVQYVVVTVSDGWLSSTTAVQITVSNDHVPALVPGTNLPDLTMYQGESVQGYFDLDDYFMDPDGDILLYAAGNEYVGVNINLNHTVDFSAPSDWHGEEEVVFIATDPFGARVEQGIIVTVLALNQPPSIGPLPDLAVRFDLRYEFDLSPYLSDPDDPKEMLVITTNDARIAVVGRSISLLYPEYMNGSKIQVRITVSDGELTDMWMINVTISDNSPPVALVLPDHEFLEDSPIQYPLGEWLDEYFIDAEEENGLSFQAFVCSEGVTALASEGWEGFWSVVFTPEQHYYGVSCLRIRAIDSEGAIAEKTVSLTVLPVPDAPRLSLPQNIQVTLGTQVAYDLSLNLTDPDPEDEDFEYEVTSDVAGIAFEVRGSVLILDFPDWFLAGDRFSRSVELTVKVRDSHGLTDTETVTVTVFRPALAEAENTWLWVAMLISGGTAFGFFMIALGMRKRPFVIRDMMLIHNDGFLIARYEGEQKGEIDDQIMSGMLTAVLNFVEDSMAPMHDHLKTFEFQKFRVTVKRGSKVYAAVVFEGDPPDGIEDEIGSFLHTIERVYRKSISTWTGDLETDFAGVGLLIQAFVKAHSRGENGESIRFLKKRTRKGETTDEVPAR